eukprot:1043191-Pelagomonas_calceolata.AAC.3
MHQTPSCSKRSYISFESLKIGVGVVKLLSLALEQDEMSSMIHSMDNKTIRMHAELGQVGTENNVSTLLFLVILQLSPQTTCSKGPLGLTSSARLLSFPFFLVKVHAWQDAPKNPDRTKIQAAAWIETSRNTAHGQKGMQELPTCDAHQCLRIGI